MVRYSSCCAFACACCLSAASGSALAWSGSDPLASGTQASAESCDDGAPCVQLWSEMTPQKRAQLWPYLDDVSKDSYWRSMSKEERRELRSCLTDRDKEAMRRRFSVDTRVEAAPAKHPKLCQKDMRLMREQILEVHMNYARGTQVRRGAHDLASPAQK